MKRLLFTLALFILSLTLYAQTGLYSLSYGDSYKTANATLTQTPLGLKLVEKEDGVYTYAGENKDRIDRIVLYFDTKADKLASWRIYYDIMYDDEEMDKVYEKVASLHGEDFYEHEYYYCDVLDLGKGKLLNIGCDYNEWFFVEYYNEAYPQYSVIDE